MNKNLQALEQLNKVSSAIIKTPSLSLADFGIAKKEGRLMYTGVVSAAAMGIYSGIAAGSVGLMGTSAIVGTGALSGIGMIAGAAAGGTAGAVGASAATGIGIGVTVAIAAGGYLYYRKKKKEKLEKERLRREIIRKQQAAIQKMKDVNIELEKRLRSQQSENEQLKAEIPRLQNELSNLTELIDILTEQIKQFKDAA